MATKLVEQDFFRTLAFTTVTGSNGVTSLVGTTGVDTATVLTLDKDVFIGGNTGNDIVTTALGTGGNNLSNYDVRMGGGDDQFTVGNNITSSNLYLDGETLGNDGADAFTFNAGNVMTRTELRGAGGNDVITINGGVSNSTINGNTGEDALTTTGNLTFSLLLGGQGIDTINVNGATNNANINGNRGNDIINMGAGVTSTSTTVFGGQGIDTINNANATDGIQIEGNLGDDTLSDVQGLTAGGNTTAVDTTFLGGDGADTILGGEGGDTMTGGAGADRFLFNLTEDSLVTDIDFITDFSAAAGDTIESSGANLAMTAFINGITDVQRRTTGSGATLTATMQSVQAGNLATVAQLVNVNTGTFAGNYIVLNTANNTFNALTSQVTQVASLGGITGATFV